MYGFGKDQATEIYYVIVKTFLIAYLTGVYMICLIFPRVSQLALIFIG